MSYSLEWEEKTGKLVALTIMAGGEGVTVASDKPSHTQSVTSVPVASTSGQRKAVEQSNHSPPMGEHDTAMAEQEARMETERVEHETRMVEERAAQAVRMKEDVVRHDAETAAYLASQGLQPPQ